MYGFKDFLRDHSIEPLLEMATVCSKNDGYGIILKVYSRNEHNPPHMHLFDIHGRELGKVILTDENPKTIDDLRFDKDIKPLTSKIKRAIVKWGNVSQSKYRNMTNWEVARMQWDIFAKDW